MYETDEPMFLINKNKVIIIKTNDFNKCFINKNKFKHNNLISTNQYTRINTTTNYDTDIITNKKLYDVLKMLIDELQIDINTNKNHINNMQNEILINKNKINYLFNVDDMNTYISNM